MTTRTEGVRQSDRVSLRLPVEVTWHGASGAPLTHEAESLLVSRNGGVLRLPEKLLTGQEVFLPFSICASISGTSTSRTRRIRPMPWPAS